MTATIRRVSNSKDFDMMLKLHGDLFGEIRRLDAENYRLRNTLDALHRAELPGKATRIKLPPNCRATVDQLQQRGWTLTVHRNAKTVSVKATKVADGDSHTFDCQDRSVWGAVQSASIKCRTLDTIMVDGATA